MARLASELTLHKKPSDLIPRFSRKLLILCLSVAPVRKESYMACISLWATPSTLSFHRGTGENGSIHNALKWKSGLISLSKGSNLPTENIIQLSTSKGEQPF